MRAEVDELLSRCGGVASRAQLLDIVGRHQFDFEVRRGYLVAPFAGAWTRPWEADFVRHRAALVSVGDPVVLSHLSAVRRWDVDGAPEPEEVHVSVPDTRCPRRRDGLVIHRLARSPHHVERDGLRVVTASEAVVTSWPLFAQDARRGVAIAAVRQRIVTPDELASTVHRYPRLSGRAELEQLVRLLAEGCESELEIWGLTDVFDVVGLRHGKRQLRVHTAAGRFRLDLGFEIEKVGIELDGARYHSTPAQRERDMRRDAALAAAGWSILRFSYRRLVSDVEGCRRDTLAALAARRR